MQQLDLRLNFRDPQLGDQRRYNLPIGDTFAAIIPGGQDAASHRDLIIRYYSGRLQRISEQSPYYLPLRYPLLFPRGEFGWQPQLLIRNVTAT